MCRIVERVITHSPSLQFMKALPRARHFLCLQEYSSQQNKVPDVMEPAHDVPNHKM